MNFKFTQIPDDEMWEFNIIIWGFKERVWQIEKML